MCDEDASLYPSAMAMFEYPVGQPYWADDVEDVKNALNSLYTSFPVGCVECEISFPYTGGICTLLSYKVPDSRLLYTFQTKPYKRITKTTTYIMEAVKYNKAVVVKVFNAMLFPERMPIFRNAITTLFNLKLKGKA